MPDKEQIEQDLREQYPRPSSAATERARAAVMQAATERRRPAHHRPRLVRRRRWRPTLIMAGVVIALVAAGLAIAVSLLNVTPPRFSSAGGWHVGSTPTHSCGDLTPGRCVMASAWASTVPYRDCPNCVPPHNTLATLPPNGIVIQLTDGRERPAYGPLGSWPTQIRASQVTSGPFEGVPRTNLSYAQLVVRSPHNVEHFLFVWFGRPHPTAQQLARANAELRTVRS
jgi:hypothetical protein